MSNTPKIRFKGFTEDWEQRELRTAATFSKGSGYSKNDLKENGTPIILYGRLYTKYETVISEVDTFVDVQPNSVYSTGREVIVPASGETAEDISRASFVAKSGILLGGDLNIIVPDDYINPVFLALTISNGNQQKELSKRAQGKSVVHIHNSDLENVVLLYPSYDEQKKIGAYFSKLDNLITLHQRKCDSLQKFKKSMLQKMFPKNGENVPEVRFAGFTDAWEQRKLGEVTESIKNGYSYKADGSRDHTYKITRIESISTGIINTDKLGSSDEINESYRLQDGDILFSHINSLQYIANTALYTSNLGEIYHGMNLLNIRAKSNLINSHFLLHLLKIESNRDWFRTVAKPAVNQASISTTEVGAFEFLLPILKEQQVIADYFDNLDTLITLHQRKLETLQKMKKSMLQKMFV